ncbi:Cbb3-type cytochrome c oxidase subunit CcoP2 [mine drainage metagenome]|uniref:Cbb3-type cytochrome c oxidase subunit CcoP2 n=1 Tax=mine drainage metagenome TaxID=410659 RepID=A0A1J5TJ52_9ZZZZ
MKKILKKYSWLKLKVIIAATLLFPSVVFAAGPPAESELSNPLAIALMIVIVGLLLVIALLANIIIGAAKLNLQRFIDEKKKSNAGKIASIILLCCLTTAAFAADAPATAAAADTSIAGLSQMSFYSLLGVIFLELVILIVLLFNLKKLLKQETIAVQSADGTAVTTATSFSAWWNKINKFRPIKEEAQIDLGHDYDGIRELDNRLPPWWLYGFYVCILFAAIYLYRYHVAHSAPLSGEELKIEMAKADAEKQAYLKKSANNIDETTAKLLTDPKDLDAAKKIFSTICAACHRPDGGGVVGPNLTDDYWIHGGNIKDIFKTIKYGYPDKGMKSWKDDYTPLQIEQLASYVKSLHGTNPPNPKEPQGTLYKEDGAATTAAKTDSTKK